MQKCLFLGLRLESGVGVGPRVFGARERLEREEGRPEAALAQGSGVAGVTAAHVGLAGVRERSKAAGAGALLSRGQRVRRLGERLERVKRVHPGVERKLRVHYLGIRRRESRVDTGWKTWGGREARGRGEPGVDHIHRRHPIGWVPFADDATSYAGSSVSGGQTLGRASQSQVIGIGVQLKFTNKKNKGQIQVLGEKAVAKNEHNRTCMSAVHFLLGKGTEADSAAVFSRIIFEQKAD